MSSKSLFSYHMVITLNALPWERSAIDAIDCGYSRSKNSMSPRSSNRPRSIYQYSNMAPRLSGQNCKFFKFRLCLNSQKRLEYKENNTKYRSLTRKPRSHVRILIYRTWPIERFSCLLLFVMRCYTQVSVFHFPG